MSSFLHRLFGRPASAPARTAITPGRLYALMSADFKAAQRSCTVCVMPLPYTCERTSIDTGNWRIERLASDCDECTTLAWRIADKYAAMYDVRDVYWRDGGETPWAEEPYEHQQFG